MSAPQWQNNPQQDPKQHRRDPRQPFGSPTPDSFNAPTQIEAYQQPRSGVMRNILIGVAALAIVAAIFLSIQYLSPDRDETSNRPGGSAAPSVATSSLGAGSQSAPFDANGGGTFEVLSHVWLDDGVDVTVRITLNEGSASFDAYLLSNTTMKNYDPVNSSPVIVDSSEPTEVTFQFKAPRGKSTVILATGGGKAITGLEISPP